MALIGVLGRIDRIDGAEVQGRADVAEGEGDCGVGVGVEWREERD